MAIGGSYSTAANVLYWIETVNNELNVVNVTVVFNF